MLKRALSLCVALSVFAGMAAGQSGPAPSLSFIDRWGEDAPQFVEYDLARIRLTDPSLDVSGQRDTVNVNVSSVLGPDLEAVTLTETGKRTGVFEGGIDLRINGGSPAFPGILETMGPSGAFDSIQVDADGGLSDTAQVVPSILRLVDDQGDEAPAVAAGGRVFVRLIDRHSDTPSPDTTTVTVTTSSGDSEVLTLTENAVRGGEFTGSIPGRLAAGAAPGDGILDTLAGETLTASHEDVNNVTSSTDTAPVSGATLRFVGSGGFPASTALAETKITLQAINAGADSNPLAVDFVYATLTSTLGGESETLALWETGASTGVFEGRMRVTTSQYSGPGDGRIRISPSNTNPDTLEASASGAAPVTIRATGSLTRLLDVWGNDAETFPQGGTLTVRVEDPSLSNPYYGFQISTAVVQSQTTGDVESLPVHETGVGSSVFEGTLVLETGAAVPGDGKLQAQVEGEVLVAEHADANGVTSSSDTGRLSSAEMWFLDDGGRPTETVLEEGTLRLRLFDSFRTTPGAADILSEVAGDGENLFFSAVPGSPGSFEGSMPTEHLTWYFPTGDGILSTRYDESSLDELDTIRAFASGTSASARAAFSQLHFVDSHGNEAESFAAGETLHVRLRLNAFGTPGIDQSWVLLLSPVTGDSETVTLTETGPETNVYEGSLPTGTGTASIADGQLQVRIGEIVVAQEDRADGPFAFALDSAAITASRVTFVDQNDVPVETFLRGGRVYLEAFDRAANNYANGVESLDVTVRVYADREGRLVDTETVSLIETGDDTSLFRGSIPMSINSSSTGGVLDTAYYLPYEGPDRLRATLGDSTDSAGLTDSILRFLDASGNDVSTYPVGGTIYLRLLRGRGTTSESLVDTLSVSLSSWTGRAGPLSSFDSASLELTETGLDTGVFEGQITAMAGPADFNDSLFQVSPGGEIQALFGSSWTEDGDRAFIVDGVTPENDPPVANDDSATVDENSFVEIDVLANDTDPNGDPLSIVSYTQGTKGSVSASGAGLLYTPNPDTFGGDSFTYTIEDPSGATATATVSVTILEANNPPVAVADNITLNEDTPLGFGLLSNDSDADGDPLTISAVTQGSHGRVLRFSTMVFYEPNANYFGTDTFTYTVSDGKGGTAVGTVFVTVNPVNDAPNAVNENVVMDEDTQITINVLANDSDVEGDPLTITSATQGSKGTVAVNGGATVTYTPNPNLTGVDTFTYTVSDGNGGTKTATVWMSINGINDPPAAVGDSRTTPEATAVNIAVLVNDSDLENQALTVTAVTQGANGSVVINPDNTVTYTPAGGFSGSDSFTYTISDGSLTATATVAMTVTPANQPPHAVEDQVTVAEDATVTIDVLANDSDPEGATLSVASVLPATHGVARLNGDFTVTYTPKPNFHGADFFVYTVSDPGSATNTAAVLITVTPVDDAPVAVNDAATVAEDAPATAVNVLANDTDLDGGAKSVASVTQPANGTVLITGGGTELTYQPNANFCNTPDTFTYTLAPGGSTATVTVTVTCVEDSPAAVADAATVAEDSGANPINVLANDTDPDGGPIGIGSVTQPSNGTVAITGGGTGLAYQPNANFCGTPDSFTYTLSPGGSTAAVSVTVTCVNDGPVVDLDANDDQGTSGNGFAATFTEGEAAKLIEDPLDATVADIDSATLASLTVTVTNLLDAGSETLSADVTGTSITADYVPATGVLTLTGPDTLANFEAVLRTVTYLNTGEDSDATPRAIRFVANDGSADGNVALSTVTVVPVDDPPAAVNDAATVTEDSGANALDVLANDTDPDGGPIEIGSVTQPPNGTVGITGGGTGLAYQPNANFCDTPDTFTYTLSPGGSTATVTVTVTCVDDNPVAVADAAAVAEDSAANAIDVLANDTDSDSGPISVQSVTQPANGTVAITGGGAGLTYQPNANHCTAGTPDAFTYTLSPGGSSTTVTVTVTCADDNPAAVADAATVLEDSGANAIDVRANDTDIDGGPGAISSVTQPANGTVAITGGGAGLTYTPNVNFCNTPETFTYTLSPGGSTATVTVTVTCVDDPAAAVADTAAAIEDSGANLIYVLANDTDPDGGTNTVSAVTQPANGTAGIASNGAFLMYTPPPHFCSATPETFSYTISPGGSTATVTVTVACVDDMPIAMLDAATVNEDSGANVINVLANDTDIDAGPISITSVTQPLYGTVVITNGGADLTYTPDANYCGTHGPFHYTLAPGGSTAAVSVFVTCVNDGPVVDLDANNDQGTSGNDFAVTFTEGQAAKLIEDPLDATATDVDSATLASLTVTITNLIDPGSETLSADVTGTSITAGYVPATGVLTLTGPDTVANFQTVLRKVRYLNTNENPDATPRVIHFVANDGSANGNTAVSTVTVVPVDNPPAAVNDAATVNEDSAANAIDVLANDTDVDGGAISIGSMTQPANGTVVITGGGTGLTYQPNANFCNTPDAFTYTLTPGGSTATVAVTVTCANDAPDAVNDVAATAEDTVVTVSVLANDTDVDGNPLQVTAVTQGTKGAVTINADNTVTYTPALNTNGADAFTYTVSDGNGGSDTATVTVSVAAVNDAPVAAADTATTREGAAVTVSVLANDSDVEGNTLTVTSATTPAGGTAAVNANNTVTYTPDANFNGTDSFTCTISDGQGGTATAAVTVTVTDALERVAVLATHGVWIQTGADVLSGDVIVNQAGTAPFLTGSVELSLAGTVTTPAGYDVQANRINVASGATVASDVFYNQLTGTVTGPQTSPLPLPVFSTLPTFLTATPGTTDVNVGTNGTRTLAAGSYRDLIVGRKGTVTFTGGTYHFRTVQIDREAKLFFTAASTVRIQQKLTALQTTQIRPAAGATIDGSDIVIHAGGGNGTGGGLTETPKAVELGNDNVIWANVYAPNGTIWMKDRTQVRGVLLGKDVQLGPDVQVTLDSSFTGQ